MLAACDVVGLLQLDEEMADVSRRDLARFADALVFEVFEKWSQFLPVELEAARRGVACLAVEKEFAERRTFPLMILGGVRSVRLVLVIEACPG